MDDSATWRDIYLASPDVVVEPWQTRVWEQLATALDDGYEARWIRTRQHGRDALMRYLAERLGPSPLDD